MASSDLKADFDVVNCVKHLNLTVHRMRRIFAPDDKEFQLEFCVANQKKTFIVMQM